MKLDKETLLKEHFWFLLALALPLALVSLILLWTTSSGLIAAPQKKIKDAETDLTRIKNKPKHPRWIDALKKREAAAVAQQKIVWEKNWQGQEKLMTWPTSFGPQIVAELSRMYFGDEISGSIRSAFPGNYPGQVDDIIQVVQPENRFNQVLVQAHDDWKKLLRWVPAWEHLPPTSEDLWLAQEDLWVQRGLLQIVRDVNDAAATFTGKGEPTQMVFTNPDWMLELKLAQAQGKPVLNYRLTNIGSRRQSLGFSFEITFTGASSHGFLPIDGEPLAPGKSIPAEGEQVLPGKAKPGEWSIPDDVGRPTGITSVHQIFDWRTVPVKRVDKIVLGALSHRQSGLELKAAKVFADKQQQDAGAAPAGAAGGVSRPGADRGTSATPEVAASGKPAGAEDLSLNGLVRKRYISTTDEVRRMPVAMVLIVDQAHVQDVLAAVANSPLRIQITQWLWRRYHGDIKPREEEKVIAGDTERGREGRPGRPAIGAEPRPGLPPFAGRPGAPPLASGPTGPGMASEEQEWDLIELSIYGVASLYERYPPKQQAKADATTTAPAAATAPATGPAAAPRGGATAAPAPGPAVAPSRGGAAAAPAPPARPMAK